MASEDDHSSASPTPAGDEPQRFTAVNNTPSTGAATANMGVATTVASNASTGAPTTSAPPPVAVASVFGGPMSMSPLLPPTAGSANGTQPSLSPEHLATTLTEGWKSIQPVESLDATGQKKRKRSIDELDASGRAVSPTTQTQRHHLAAHEAAMAGGVGSDPSVRAPSIHLPGEGFGKEEHGRLHDSFRQGGLQDGSPQVDPTKQRKRQFSNRTKTGCITCRRRKKKCDEEKPECKNCKRGGFVCEGYSSKVNWQKPTPGKNNASHTSTLIQSKDHGDPQTASPSPVHARAGVMPAPPQPPRDYATRPLDGNKQPSETPSSPNSVIRPVPPGYTGPSTHETTYSRPPHASAPNPAQPSTLGNTSTTPQHDDATRRLSFTAPVLTQAAGSSVPRQRSDKEKMINSELYHSNAAELVAEREICKAACWRYNYAASNPNLGISEAEKGRLLLDILRPGSTWEVVSTGAAPGSQGAITYVSDNGYQSDIVDVTVDAPFTCSYGYNIHLGKNVNIEFGCTILDSCEVTIKARTILSPNVSIYSATHPIDPRKRNGSSGPEMAKPVMIEEDCWLGGNVIVLGGITIGKGSVVGAGSVVTRDVPPFTVVAGNPARVIRGIYQNGIDM